MFRERFSFYYRRTYADSWAALALSLHVFGRVSQGSSVIIYRDTGDAFRAMWEAVDTANERVFWQTYICKEDHVGKTTVAKLEQAHDRGVKTELLYDCGGNISGRHRLTERLRQLGASVIRHRPFFSFLWPYFSSGMNWQLSPGIRNHRKILLIDQRAAFVGGLNIGDDYCGTALGGNGRFRDTHCQVVGPAVQHVEEVYNDTKHARPSHSVVRRWRHILHAIAKQRRRGWSPASLFRSGSLQRKRHEERLAWWKSVRRHVVSRMRMPTTTAAAEAPGAGGVSASGKSRRPTLRWIRQQLLQNRLRMPKNGPRNARHAMHARLLHWQTRAQQAVDRQLLRSAQRRESEALLRKPIRDDEPVPESRSIHATIPEFTQVLMCNPHSRDWSLQLALWQVACKAHRRLWVTTPYYMPHRKLTVALLRAAKRGVDVRIMAGSRATTDPWFMWFASRYLASKFLRAGVRIYEFHGEQVMHAKTVVVDSVWSCIGSYNWDAMSNKNLEVCVSQFSVETATELERHFLLDASQSVEVQLTDVESQSLSYRLLSFVAFQGLRILEKLTFLTYKDPDLQSELE